MKILGVFIALMFVFMGLPAHGADRADLRQQALAAGCTKLKYGHQSNTMDPDKGIALKFTLGMHYKICANGPVPIAIVYNTVYRLDKIGSGCGDFQNWTLNADVIGDWNVPSKKWNCDKSKRIYRKVFYPPQQTETVWKTDSKAKRCLNLNAEIAVGSGRPDWGPSKVAGLCFFRR